MYRKYLKIFALKVDSKHIIDILGIYIRNIHRLLVLNSWQQMESEYQELLIQDA